MAITTSSEKHPCCRGEYRDSPVGVVYVCGYNTVIQCEECRYRTNHNFSYLEVRKNPEAKGNRPLGGRAEQLTFFPRKEYGTE
jgi:hypothetical protein